MNQSYKYKKLATAADTDGCDFEVRMLTLVYLRKKRHGGMFSIASNVDELLGKFDDIVVMQAKADGMLRVDAIQLKHKTNSTLTKSQLMSLGSKADFGLKTHCDSLKSKNRKEMENFFGCKLEKVDLNYYIFTNAKSAALGDIVGERTYLSTEPTANKEGNPIDIHSQYKLRRNGLEYKTVWLKELKDDILQFVKDNPIIESFDGDSGFQKLDDITDNKRLQTVCEETHYACLALMDSSVENDVKLGKELKKFWDFCMAMNWGKMGDIDLKNGQQSFELTRSHYVLNEMVNIARIKRRVTELHAKVKEVFFKEQPHIGMFAKLENVTENTKYDDFLSKLQLFTKQASLKKLDELIGKELEVYFKFDNNGDRVRQAGKLTAEIKKWWQIRGNKIDFLTNKSDILRKVIAVAYCEKKARELSSYGIAFTEGTLKNLLREIPEDGGVFLVRAKTSTAVTAAMIMQALSKADSLPLSEEEKARCWAKSCGKYSHLFVDLQTMHNCKKELLFTWEHTDIHTLVVECYTELCVEEERNLIEELARVSTKLKKNAKKLLVLLLPDGRQLNGQADLGCPREYPDNFTGSLLDEKSLQHLANMEVNLQGVSIKLSDLFAGGDQTFLKQINSCALSQLLKNDIRCGKDLAKEDGVFVERRLKNGTPNEIPFVAKSALDVEEKMVLMVADPGMGKSTLIKHLAIQAKDKDPSAWVVVIRLNDWAHLFDNDRVHALNFLVQCELTEGNELERQVFHFGKTKLIVFVDGVDEMFPGYLNQVATLLAEMKDLEKVERLWITSRPVCQEALESALGVTAHALQGLSGKEQQLLHKETWKSVEKLQLVAFANRFQYLETLLGVNELDIVLKSPLLAMRAFAKDNPPNNAPAFFKECIQDIFEIYCRDKLKISHVSLPAIVDVKNNLKTDFVQIHGQVAASNTDLNHDFQAIRQEILAYKTQDFNRRVEERHDVTGIQRHARGEHDSRFFCPQMAPHLVTMLREQQHSANYPTLVPTRRISLLKWGIIVCLLLWFYVVIYPILH